MPSHACERCHRRKVRCDKAVPQCAPCRRSGVDCHYAASEAQLRRRHIQKLERRIRDLQDANDALTERLEQESRAAAQSPRGGVPLGRGGSRRNEGCDVADEVIQMSLIAGGEHNFVGSTSGLLLANLLRPRPHDARSPSASLPAPSRSLLAADSARHTDSDAAPDARFPGGNTGPAAALPPRSLAEDLVRAYCAHDHLAYPFLSPRSLHAALEAVYSAAAGERGPASAVDAFFVDMTLAIAAARVHRFNWSGVGDAEAHCARAMARLGDVLARDGIERVQALLLVCQYRMGTTSSDTSTSVWHLIGVAARTCLEMGLHRGSTYALPDDGGGQEGGGDRDASRSVAREEMETRKRCFWSLVALDRITSLALGRPLAIQLEDIDVDFPDCGPPEGEQPSPQGDNTPSAATYGTPQYHAATSIFVHIVKYRLICGKVLNALHRASRHAPPPGGSAHYVEVREELEQELKEWHAQTGSLQLSRLGDEAASPEGSSSFRCEEWYQLLFHNGMLMLFRPASTTRAGRPSDSTPTSTAPGE
ncbi:hypothetical protein VUR80DRAFT_1327 [Thermomyces stellatus]